RAAAHRFLDEGVAIEALARERDEEVSGGNPAAVGRDAGDRHARAMQRSRGGDGDVVEAHHDRRSKEVAIHVPSPPAIHSSSAARATSRSLNGTRVPAISW